MHRLTITAMLTISGRLEKVALTADYGSQEHAEAAGLAFLRAIGGGTIYQGQTPRKAANKTKATAKITHKDGQTLKTYEMPEYALITDFDFSFVNLFSR